MTEQEEGAGWDGLERRQTPHVIEEVGKRVSEALNHREPVAELSLVQQLLISAVVLVMLALALFNQFRLMDNLNAHRDASQVYQKSLVCILLIPPENRSNDSLARCGLLAIPGQR